jgi:hypothetical protein
VALIVGIFNKVGASKRYIDHKTFCHDEDYSIEHLFDRSFGRLRIFSRCQT